MEGKDVKGMGRGEDRESGGRARLGYLSTGPLVLGYSTAVVMLPISYVLLLVFHHPLTLSFQA